ncbi:hypothetical protein [Pasteurella testudinis]|uniref:hypothetical protein n=1 Tax=Pasteurella testudinis TaxID=761 RepID=UPI0040587D3F
MARLVIFNSATSANNKPLRRLVAEFERQILAKWASTRIQHYLLTALTAEQILAVRETVATADYLAFVLDYAELNAALPLPCGVLPNVPSVIFLAAPPSLPPHLQISSHLQIKPQVEVNARLTAQFNNIGLQHLQFVLLQNGEQGYPQALRQLAQIMAC